MFEWQQVRYMRLAELGAVIDVASPEGEPVATGELTGIAPTGGFALSGEWLIEGAYLELGDDREVWVPEDALWRRVPPAAAGAVSA